MSNVNDNNLDDLLRRAAEKYPLRTDSSDWGKLAADLDKDPSLILPPVNGEDGRRRRRFFWLFLLLPLAGVGYYTWHAAGRSASLAGQTSVAAGKDGLAPANTGEKGGDASGATPGQREAGQSGEAEGQKGQAQTGEKKGDVSGATPGQSGATRGQNGTRPGQSGQVQAGEKKGDVSGDIAGGKTAGQTEQAKIAAIEKGRQTNAPEQDHPINGQGQDRQINRPGHDRPANVAGQASGAAVKDGRAQASGTSDDGGQAIVQTNARPQKGGHVGGKTAGQIGQVSVLAETPGHNSGATPGQGGQAGLVSGRTGNVKNGQDEGGLHLASNNLQRANTKMRSDVAANNISLKSDAVGQTKDNTKKDKSKPQKPKSFYVGILGSPDLSTIKWQSVKNVGATYGLLLGYSFNSRWSIESGVYYSKKKYFTDGEYFDKSKAYLLKYVDSLKIDGVCNMWEIPLSVRYNLSTSEKTKWFATAGVSAYYMSNEKYYCTGIYNGGPWHEGWDKKPSQNSWSANLSLSVGYEQRLGKIGDLRLEPYVRLPMSGIGTGKLSIMSAGLNLGITRRIW